MPTVKKPYDKQWKSLDEQIELMNSRGLIISDTHLAKEHLSKIGYYRLSGYLYPFKDLSCPKSSFKPNASFEDAINLYIFDKKLRVLVLDALERIEIALRVDIAYLLGKEDPFALKNKDLFDPLFTKPLPPKKGQTVTEKSKYDNWLSKHNGLIERSKETFMNHYKENYYPPIPIWIACEVWDFGTLSMLFGGMQRIHQNRIAEKYGITHGQDLSSWLHCLNYLRNVCAHHSRLWNLNMDIRPRLPQHLRWLDSFRSDKNHKAPEAYSKPFLLICMLAYLLPSISPRSTCLSRIKTHLLSFPKLDHVSVSIRRMGVIQGWEAWELWEQKKKAPQQEILTDQKIN